MLLKASNAYADFTDTKTLPLWNMSLRESALWQPQASRVVYKTKDWLDVNHLRDKINFTGE